MLQTRIYGLDVRDIAFRFDRGIIDWRSSLLFIKREAWRGWLAVKGSNLGILFVCEGKLMSIRKTPGFAPVWI